MDLIGLLQAKNRCLIRLLALSRDFTLDSPNAAKNDGDPFEELLLQREVLLRTIQLFDKKIGEIARAMPDPSAQLIADVRACLTEREELVAHILKEDERVIEKIEIKKAEVVKDMLANQKSADQVRRFRSQPAAHVGEGLDKKL